MCLNLYTDTGESVSGLNTLSTARNCGVQLNVEFLSY